MDTKRRNTSAKPLQFKASYWIALKFPDSAAIMKQLQAVIPAAWNDSQRECWITAICPGSRCARRSRWRRGGHSTIISIKQDLLSEAEFSVPKDFQEMKIPNLDGHACRQADAAPATKP